MTDKFRGPGGCQVYFEPSTALPLVHLSLSLRSGSTFDPEGLEGLGRLSARMLRMGTRTWTPEAVEDRVDELGAHLGIGIGPAYTHVAGTVVARNVDAFFSLMTELVREPAFRNKDLNQLKRETQAALLASLDDDGALAGRRFRAEAMGGHPYGRPVAGNRRSVGRVDRNSVIAHHAAHWVGSNVLVGISGPLTLDEAKALVERQLAWLPRGPRPRMQVPAPHFPRGRRLVVVDKPSRTQTQILIGSLGTWPRDPHNVPLCVANTAFGGLFTSRLTNEVRAKRGWSYGASSGFGQQPRRDLWTMRTAPAAKDAAACIALQLSLLERWVRAPLSPRELRAAKDYLVKSAPFEYDTASKRLDQAVDRVLFDLPVDYREKFVPRVKQVTRASAHAAVAKRISLRDQLIVVVGTEKDLRADLGGLPGIAETRVVPFDRD